ncbi:MAG: GAF domain-containing protein [Planctomycetota bacterium]
MNEAAGLRRGCGSAETYEALRAAALRLAVAEPSPERRLAPLCDLMWDALSPSGLSWIGFYLEESEPQDPDAPAGAEGGGMVLVARRDKPACSPIGLHGVCGQAFLEESVRLVEDVALLGAGYIACDPRDRSELVVPVYRNGARWGVLDADSHEQACFGLSDIHGFCSVLRAAGLLGKDLPLRADRLQSTRESL